MLPSRKAQGGAAILIALIAALIILYVLFLPPADRAELLGEAPPGSNGGSTTPAADIIYSSPVGSVVVPVKPIANDDLASVNLRVSESGGVLGKLTTAVVESNVFEKSNAQISFSANPSLTRNVILALNVRSSTGGNLIVKLNGKEIYNREPLSKSIPPITLENLQEQNTLEISTSTVGFAFWRTNRLTLSEIVVAADVKDISGSTATQRFVVNADELKDVSRAELSFVPICNVRGIINIQLNNAELYDGAPDCEALNVIELAPTRIVEGENILHWSTDSGDILIDRARITVESKKQDNRVFTFQIDPAKVAGRPIMLRVFFSDSLSKQGYVTINGNRLPIQGGSTYGMPITTALRPDANTISFEALGDPFEIVRFEVIRG